MSEALKPYFKKGIFKKIKKHNEKYKSLPLPLIPFRICVYSPSFSGKSYTINDMFFRYNYNKIFKAHNIFVMSPTFIMDESYKDIRKYMEDLDDNIIDNYDEDFLSKIIERQKDCKTEKTLEPVLVIVDDLITEIPITRNNVIKNLFLKGRHYGISCIITSQVYKLMPKGIRLNANGSIYFVNNMNKRERNDISEEQSTDYFNEMCNFIRDVDYNQYDFLFVNPKLKMSERFYRNFNKKLILEDIKNFKDD